MKYGHPSILLLDFSTTLINLVFVELEVLLYLN